ncbi:hypothetical protein [Solilutibacter pythonis]|nr:hypothetical protein [Lysobacter pythonis]
MEAAARRRRSGEWMSEAGGASMAVNFNLDEDGRPKPLDGGLHGSHAPYAHD